MSRVTPVALATKYRWEMHLMTNKINPIYPLPSAVPSRPSRSLVRERRRSCVRCIRRALRCRLLRRFTRTTCASELTQQEAAIQRHIGPHRPACLPSFLCIWGHSGVAEQPYRTTQCGWVMPRRSPDLPTMSIHLPASLATPEQSTSCAATVLSGQKPVPMLSLRIVIQCH